MKTATPFRKCRSGSVKNWVIRKNYEAFICLDRLKEWTLKQISLRILHIMKNSLNKSPNYSLVTTEKKKFSIKDFFSICDQIRSFLRFWSHLLKKSWVGIRIDRFYLICSQLLLLFFLEVYSMNAFLNDQINIFCCKHLKCYFFAYIIFTFCVYLLLATNKCFIIVIKYDLFWRMLPKFTPFSSSVCLRSWCLNQDQYSCSSGVKKTVLVFKISEAKVFVKCC